MEISNRKARYPWEYDKEGFKRRLLKEYIRRIRNTMKEGKINVANPFPEVHKIFNQEQTRAMRDFNKYQELIAPFAIFKIYQRPIVIIKGKRYLLPSVQDALDAKTAFDSILQTTQTGTDQRTISFYWETVIKNPNSTAEQLTDIYNKERKRPVSTNTMRAYLKRLIEIEWVDERECEHENTKGYVDKRFKSYSPLKKSLNGSNLSFEADLRTYLENSFKNWLKTVTEENLLHPQIIMPRIDGTALQISIEEMENIILGKQVLRISLRENQDSVETLSQPNLELNQKNNIATASKTETETLDNSLQSLFYRRLSASRQRPCDGEGKGGPCPHLAEYEMLSSDNPIKPCYCEGHFKKTRISCTENGFRLVEQELKEVEAVFSWLRF
jgi:hypothetical protein